MIKNETQYRTTQEAIRRFQESLALVQQKKTIEGDSLSLEMHISAFENQISDLLEEIEEYESRLNHEYSA